MSCIVAIEANAGFAFSKLADCILCISSVRIFSSRQTNLPVKMLINVSGKLVDL